MNELMTTLSNKVQTNNLLELKKYIEETDNGIKNNSNAIKYGYDLNLNLYKTNTDNGIVRTNPSTVMKAMGMGDMVDAHNNSGIMSMAGSSFSMNQYDAWIELLDNPDLLKTQYDLLAGHWPESYNEVVLTVGEDNEISDYTLYTLGLKDQKELEEKMDKIMKGEKIEASENTSYTYDELLNLTYKIILNSDYYKKENGVWLDKSEDEEYMKEKIANAEEIKVVGIIKQNAQAMISGMPGYIGYTKDLKEYVINKSNEAEIVKEQKDNEKVSVFSGLEFPTEDDNKAFDYNSLSNEQKMAMSKLSSEEIAQLMEAYTENKNASYEKNLQKLGAINLESPSTISIYPKGFEEKDKIAEAIEEYNKKQKDEGKESEKSS